MEENLPAIKIDVLSAAPQIIEQNKVSLQRATAAAEVLLQKISTGMTPELDDEAKKLIIKLKETEKVCNERRIGITRMFDEVTKYFTSIEKQLNEKTATSVTARLQKLRDEFAAAELERRREEEKQAQSKLYKANELINIRAAIKLLFNNSFADYLLKRKYALAEVFNTLNLYNSEKVLNDIMEFKDEYPFTFHKSIFYDEQAQYATEEEIISIQDEVRAETYAPFKQQFYKEIVALRLELQNKIPFKIDELQEIANAKGDDAERLLSNQAARMKEDLENIAALAADLKKQANEEVIQEKAQQESITLFNAIPIDEAPAAKVKESYSIKVINPAGWLSIVQFYFTGEGMQEDAEKLSTKTLGSMRLYAERRANKDDTKIVSKFLVYETKVKAK